MHTHWREDMQVEMEGIIRNNTWVLTDLPADKQAVTLKWVFKTKLAPDASVQKHKARLVAQGFTQEQGVDFEETYSPVARFDTIRLFIALAAQNQWAV